MRSMAILLSIFCMSYAAFAERVPVLKATYTPKNHQLVLWVQYAGGCIEHEFRLHIQASPGKAEATAFVDDITAGQDSCIGVLRKRIEFTLTQNPNTFKGVIRFEGKENGEGIWVRIL